MNKKWLISLVFISFMPLIDLFHPGLFVAHDSVDHVARIANFYQNLSEGVLIPRWAANLNWGYGHPILMFLYPLPSYIASLFHLIGFSFIDAAKIVFGLGFILSGIAMYYWVREEYGTPAGFVAGIMYMVAPYRFADLYVRGAIGENFFFIFPPFVAYFICKLAKRFHLKYIAGGAFAIAGMILSHNALMLMFLPFLLFYTAITIIRFKPRHVRGYVVHLVLWLLGFGLTAFFWIPAFFEGKYTLRDIVTKGEIVNRFETISRLIYSPWSFGGTGMMSVQIGLVQWIIVVIATIISVKLIVRRSVPLRFTVRLMWLLLTNFTVSILLMLPISAPFYQQFTILQKFQFPWRFVSLAVFSAAATAGILVSLMPKKRLTIYIVGITLILFVVNYNYWHAKSYLDKPDSFFSGVYYGTTDTGESAPIWSVRFMEHPARAPVEIVEGAATITFMKRSVTKHDYVVDVTSDSVRMLDNTLYFPGWTVYVDGIKKNVTDILFQDPNYRGLINFFLTKGSHTINILFENTKVRTIAELLSLFSLGILLIFSIYGKVIKRKHIISK